MRWTAPNRPADEEGPCGDDAHDYKRNGTTTLFAALNVATGEAVGECYERHRHDEFLAFRVSRLPQEAQTADAKGPRPAPDRRQLRHPQAPGRAGLARQASRVHLHFTPTSTSWLNLVECFFGEITQNRIRRGVFKSVAELEAAIGTYLDHRNREPRPFTWTAPVASILEKTARAKVMLETLH